MAIDVHAHCIIPEAMAVVGQDASAHHQPGIVLVPEDRIRVMDEQGIDVAMARADTAKAEREAAKDRAVLLAEKGDDANASEQRVELIRKALERQAPFSVRVMARYSF